MGPAQRIVTQLFFSMISVVLLVYFNTDVFIESLEMLDEVNSPDYENADKVDSEGIVVITFAGLGLLFDAICLYAYYHFAKKDAEAEYQAMQAQLTESQKTGVDAAKIEKPDINMPSASGGVPSVTGFPHLQAFRWMRRKKVLVIFCLDGRLLMFRQFCLNRWSICFGCIPPNFKYF